MSTQVGGLDVHIIQGGTGVGQFELYILELPRVVGGVEVFLMEPVYAPIINGGHRTYPLRDSLAVLQTQTGKRAFPKPGSQ